MRTLFISLGNLPFLATLLLSPHPHLNSCAFSLVCVRNDSSKHPQASRISLSYLHCENNLGASPGGTRPASLLGKISTPPPRVRQEGWRALMCPPILSAGERSLQQADRHCCPGAGSREPNPSQNSATLQNGTTEGNGMQDSLVSFQRQLYDFLTFK